jgi:hypothetical protein
MQYAEGSQPKQLLVLLLSIVTSKCKALWHHCLTIIATDLELFRANNQGENPYEAISRIIGEYKYSFPWLNKDMVKNHIRKLNNSDELVLLQRNLCHAH